MSDPFASSWSSHFRKGWLTYAATFGIGGLLVLGATSFADLYQPADTFETATIERFVSIPDFGPGIVVRMKNGNLIRVRGGIDRLDGCRVGQPVLLERHDDSLLVARENACDLADDPE